MRKDRNQFLKSDNDSNALEEGNLAPIMSSQTIGSPCVGPYFSPHGGNQRRDRLVEWTHSKSFSDGTLIETVRDAQRPEKFRLLVYRDHKVQIENWFEQDGNIYAPAEIDHNLAQYLRLSTGASPCGQARELLSALVTVFEKYLDVPDDVLQVIGAFVLCSWFPDRLRVAPYLWLVGPLSSGKTTILKLLQALCRRAFLVGDLTPSALYRLPGLLRPTLLIDENDFGDSANSAAIRSLLRSGNSPAASVIRNGRAFDPYCVKVLASREPPADAALASRSILIGTSPSIRMLAPLDEETRERIALDFQPKLLMFRLQNFHNLHVSDDFSGLIDGMTPRIKDIAHALATPLLGDTELEKDLIDVLVRQDCEGRADRLLEPEWLVVEALFGLCHQEDGQPNRLSRKPAPVLVGGIAHNINTRMSLRAEDIRITAKRTGLILRALGIHTVSLGNMGRGIRLTHVVRKDVHKLSRQFGFDRRSLLSPGTKDPEWGGAPCALCEKFDLTGGLKFVTLSELKQAPLKSARRSLFEQEDSPESA